MKKTGPFRTRLTRRFYRRLFAAYRFVLPTDVAPGPVSPERVRRVLIARVDRVGDLVVLSPALSYLRDVLPHAEIDLLAGPRNASLLEGDPRLAHVYVHQPTALGWLRSVRRLRARRYDVVFTMRLRDHMYEGIFASLVAGRHGARLTGYRPPQYAGFFTHRVRIPLSRRHMVARLLYIARTLVGQLPAPSVDADLAAHPPTLPASPAAEARARAFAAEQLGGAPYVALNAWGSDPRRGLGVPYAADVAAAVARHRPELAVVLTAPPNKADEAADIVARAHAALRAAGAPAGAVVAAPTSRDLRDLVALMRHSAAVITPDTANAHIACALNRPLVAVYTALAVHPELWGAWGPSAHVVFLREKRPVAAVPVPDVLAALDAALAGAPAAPAEAWLPNAVPPNAAPPPTPPRACAPLPR